MTAVLSHGTVRPSRLSRDMRTLIFGAVCIAGMLTISRGIPLLVASYRATAMQLRTTHDELEQDRQIVAQRSNVLASLDRTTTAFLGASPAFLKGSSADQAAAMLASVISDAADANGVHLSSLQPVVDSTSRTLIVPILVRVSGAGDVRGVSGMLRDLEGGVPLVDVRQVTIAQPDPAAPSDRMESLHIELTARGLYRRMPGISDDKVEK